MDREIKFRGKSVLNDEWIYGDLVHRINSPKTISPVQINGIGVKEETVGQFTGLFDKNGTEIYEGDIISVNGKYPKLVKYINDYACFCLANIEDLDEEMDTGYWHQVSPGWWNSSKREIQVIGNIYDHPELIKEEYQ